MTKPTENSWMRCQPRTMKEALAELEAGIASFANARTRNVLSIWEEHLDRGVWSVALTRLFKLYSGDYCELAGICSMHLHKVLPVFSAADDTLYVIAWTLGYFADRMEDDDQS